MKKFKYNQNNNLKKRNQMMQNKLYQKIEAKEQMCKIRTLKIFKIVFKDCNQQTIKEGLQ